MLKVILTFMTACCVLLSTRQLNASGSSFSEEKTLAIIKPNAVKDNNIGAIINRLERGGLKIAAVKTVKLTPQQAAEFYRVHKGKPFYNDLVAFMSSGPVVAVALEGHGAVTRARAIMGATDPKKAEAGTIRADFAASLTENAIHGSDSGDNAKAELDFFFGPENNLSN